MTLTDVTIFINSIGFPAAVAIFLLYHVLVIERREAEAILSLVNAIDEQARVLTTLCERINRLLER